MLRLIHAQTTLGKILVSDIDDGLPNKTVKRGLGDPKAASFDGYANKPKQACYIPRANPADTTLAGFIDLQETDKVLASASKGDIAKMSAAGLISVVSFTPSDLVLPVITSATKGVPTAGDLTIVGTGFLSVSPYTSSVIITGTGAVTLTRTQITTGGGTFTNTNIVIPAALVPSIAVTTSSAAVKADGQTSVASVLV